jgi:fructokinase
MEGRMTQLYGGIEAGGTKFVCMVAGGPGDIRAELRFPTTTPQETLSRCVDFFKKQQIVLGQAISAVGIACFGPIDLQPDSPTFGYITTTPKPGWANTDVVGPIQAGLNIPVAFDHDVVVAGIGEGTWGAAQGLDNFIYLTIGTGIGGGVIVGGKPVHGLVHPEIGHMLLRRDPQRDPFEGCCPYHGDCLEGLACGLAIEKRWNKSAFELPPNHPAWEIEAGYISDAVHNLICALSPRKLILGGGVMQQAHLFPMIHQRVVRSLNGYIQSKTILDHIDEMIVPPALGNESGALGCIALAKQMLGSEAAL